MTRRLTVLLLLALTAALSAQEEGGQRRRPRFRRLPPWASQSWWMRRAADKPWSLTNANVVDVTTGRVIERAAIVIKGDRIVSVSSEPPVDGTETVDAKGGWVIPGLLDLHAHVMPKSLFFPGSKKPEEALRVLLEAGVTTIRLLPLYSESSTQWAAKIAAGELVGPTVVPSSTIFEKVPQRTSRGFGDADTARAWVRKEALVGARWIKVYNSMDPASLRTIVATAREYGMRVCGHAEDVPPLEASRIGVASIEHVISMPLSCLADGASLEGRVDILHRTVRRWEAVDDDKLKSLLGELRKNGTAWVPTLVVCEEIAKRGGHDGRLFRKKLDPKRVKAALQRAARAAIAQHRAGGLVGAGTDFPVDGVVPGKSVHRELELLVEDGGATPLEALQIATISSARILGFDALLGTVAAGKLAHLVVLDKNPIADIEAVKGVKMVVHDGRVRHRR